MAVEIKKMVDAICSLTVLELSKLVKALRDKFGLRTSDTIRTDINEAEEADTGEDGATEDAGVDEVADGSTEVSEESDKSEEKSKPVPDPSFIEPADEPSDEPSDEIEGAEADEVADGSTEVSEESDKSEEESKPVPDPSSVPVPDTLSVPVPDPLTVKRPEGEDYDLVYAWKYCGDNRYAKIGRSTKLLLNTRMPKTYHPTDNPELIGTYKCANLQHAEDVQNYILSELERTRPDLPKHEWVKIDKAFNEMIEKSFCKPPHAD